MNILAIDTATEACSVALLMSNEIKDNDVMANEVSVSTSIGNSTRRIFENEVTDLELGTMVQKALENATCDGIFEVCPQQHSQNILPMIDRLLNKHNIELSDLNAIAYGRGPGSFTGVRIAASTVQGLAFGANLPVLEISTLATMAQECYAHTDELEHLVLIDARMQEVYMGEFKIVDGIATEIQQEAVVAPEHALDILQKNPLAKASGTGYGAYQGLFSGILKGQQTTVNYPNALYMLPIAMRDLLQKNVTQANNIQPVYVRDKVTWQKLPHKR